MLRHLIGLLAGLAVAPLLWIGVAWPAGEVQGALADGGNGIGAPAVTTALGVLMAVGLLCGFFAGARISPLTAFVPGALLLTLCLWPVVDRGSLDAVLPSGIDPGSVFHPVGPALPVALPIGTLLLVSSVIPSRWSRTPRAYAPPLTEAAAHPSPLPGDAPLPGAAPRSGSHRGDLDPERTTTPFQRDPAGGWEPVPPAPESDTREFHRRGRR
ncbi:hypothetical protein ACFOVU_14075 [Nocardiopsis sediminis]|uniref:Trp biosynthesis protein n=1 Tax=Nocardiopsis sediminis TaxID=1778267 RepID=A0ABV8FLY3_9ACTN